MSPGLTDNTGRGKRIPRSALLTASLGKGAKGTGDADCHSQCAHWLRNDRFCKGCGGTGGVEPRPYGGQEDLGKPGVGRTEAFAPTELYHGVRRRGFCPARGRPQRSALRKEKRCGRAGRCRHRPLRNLQGVLTDGASGKSAKRRQWRKKRADFEEVSRLAGTTVAVSRLARRWVAWGAVGWKCDERGFL